MDTLKPSPFSPESIRRTVQDIVPPEKTGALVVIADQNGVRAMVATRFGDHWQLAGQAEWHGEHERVEFGVTVKASW